MPPLATSRQQCASLPASRAWLLAAAGVLVAGGIGTFLSNEGRQPAIIPSQKSSDHAHSLARLAGRSSSSLEIHARSVSSTPPKASANEESAWSEADKDRIRLWAQSAPRAAADWAAVLPPGANRRFVLETAALAWGDSDPAAAAQWAKSLRDEAERTLALTDIAGEAVRSAPLLAIEIACSLSTSTRDAILPRAASEWAMQEPAAAAEVLRALTGPIMVTQESPPSDSAAGA